jgi:hypothetical protein
VLVTDGVFSGDDSGGAEFHPATDLDTCDIAAVQVRIRHRGLRWLHCHGHLDDLAVHTLDSSDHAGGWSVDAPVTIADWDRHGLERLVRYCARPPLAQERLGRLNDEQLVYSLPKPTVDGRTELILTHIGEPVTPAAVLPARAPPQAELGFEPADRQAAQTAWPEVDQTGGQDSWD